MSSAIHVLALEKLVSPAWEDLTQRYAVHQFSSLDALPVAADLIQGVVTGGGTGVSPEIMAALPSVRVISVNGVGTDRIDLAEAERRGIVVATTRGVLDADVADLALALLLDVWRGVSTNDRFIRAGRWLSESPPLGTAITGKKVGIVGLGSIGQAIAERAAVFGTEIGYHTRTEKAGSSYRYFGDLEALASWCDALILALPGGGQTQGLVGDAVLRALGPNGLLINVARGSVVDEKALVAALKTGVIKGAGLDVFAHEPHVPEALFAMDNVVLQAHRGSATREVRQAMGAKVVAALDEVFGSPNGAA